MRARFAGRSRLRGRDLLRTAWIGVTSRPLRTALASLGVALGIASLAALTGVAASNQAQLLADLDRMGANLAVVSPVPGTDDQPIPLPDEAPVLLERVDGVADVGVFETAPEGAYVYRNDLIPERETNGLQVVVARPDVFSAIEARLAVGRWFDEASRGLPTTVLGRTAADRLGVSAPGDRVWIAGQWHGVIGILDSAGLATSIDTAAILPDRWVREAFEGTTIGDIDSIYVRAAPGRVDEIRDTLRSAASPGSPFVRVDTLSDLAGARTTADDSLSTLGVALAGIALLVGAVGIANTMVVTVLERRGEIGLRRSLGAKPGHVAVQFLTEAAALALIGGVVGLLLGVAAAAGFAVLNEQPVIIPLGVVLASPPVAVVVGALAGVYPSLRASRLSPTVALRSAS
ncbi:ABC transporter permease [Tessaracoccus caeni]|uniref:ABC transporter permease n=1 Tax=Tessaracoccus caeni TaxID=3031239 RepID=UPI0023DA4732|nr:ABC transporter permease [Tessaracoccus caeni]MDF1489599.1 ABC transporter permease [Tessaracoccus caeni]